MPFCPVLRPPNSISQPFEPHKIRNYSKKSGQNLFCEVWNHPEMQFWAGRKPSRHCWSENQAGPSPFCPLFFRFLLSFKLLGAGWETFKRYFRGGSKQNSFWLELGLVWEFFPVSSRQNGHLVIRSGCPSWLVRLFWRGSERKAWRDSLRLNPISGAGWLCKNRASSKMSASAWLR